jgi:hypothetical protein
LFQRLTQAVSLLRQTVIPSLCSVPASQPDLLYK